jgi:two-component system response regulator HydG
MTEHALRTLERYPWPGNVRELENAIRRAAILAAGRVLDAPDFAFLRSSAPPGSIQGYVRSVVEESRGVRSFAEIARGLGISRKTLWAWRKKWESPGGAAAANSSPSAIASLPAS